MLTQLWSRGLDFLGSRFAIMGGAMSWVSEPNLVSAISNAGGFGVLACGAMSTEELKVSILRTQQLTKLPFGVNLIVMHPELDNLVEVCIQTGVSHIVLAGGIPNGRVISTIKDAGRRSMCFAPSLSVARRLIRTGVDALIIEGMEAGGHIGPVSTSVLAQEILPFFRRNAALRDVPIFVAGGIGTGDMIGGYLKMGASGCQIGTLFVCASESMAHKNFKEVFIKSSSRDAVPSVQLSADFPVIPVRAIANAASSRFLELQREVIELYSEGKVSKEEGQLKIEKFWAGSLRKAVVEGDVEGGSLMAGQSVGLISGIRSVEQIINDLVSEAESYLLSRDEKVDS
ncbi:NAD(P)H-dependent flavin oxidoreductase [Candidatus Anaplasma sp. TIGMIC]|uniref:NAD(P)H-dependent flavin oxidoreductase n=1 Tax=Candidatus Anaplasma sp. TIGMIC TaxID=3020713 RepID=UPI00232E87F0|nr:nitronate monooxygenase [Candidatus Anaplasma sp. TIGMIC]MDB1135441.1 nitronate monooxygenase [Candidatus Anaplasma sp. TIGMIC]